MPRNYHRSGPTFVFWNPNIVAAPEWVMKATGRTAEQMAIDQAREREEKQLFAELQKRQNVVNSSSVDRFVRPQTHPIFSSSARVRSSKQRPKTPLPPPPIYSRSRTQSAYQSTSSSVSSSSSSSSSLPSCSPPVVSVHIATPHNLAKLIKDRKHPGTSRNVLGGFYTS
jgi:hypothetical protein